MEERPCRALALLGTGGRLRDRGGEHERSERKHHREIPTRSRYAVFHLALGLATLAGCGQLPDVEYETERLEIAPSFDHPICQGTLDALDEHVFRVEEQLGRAHDLDPIRVYWLDEAAIDELCGDDIGGCFYPGTRVVFSQGPSVTHEIVHAVLDSLGESYFVEEGIAELLSGTDIVHRARTSDVGPAQALHLSARAYREGALDYAAAAHFARWLFDTKGQFALRELADRIEAGASTGTVESTIEQVMEGSISSIDDEYRDTAPLYYAGLWHEDFPMLELESLAGGIVQRLSCAEPDTRGPLQDGSDGMYRTTRLWVPEGTDVVLNVFGPEGTWVDVIDPWLGDGWQRATDWALPDPDIDPGALHLRPGDNVGARLRSGTYLVVFGSDGLEPVEVTFGLRRVNVVPERNLPGE